MNKKIKIAVITALGINFGIQSQIHESSNGNIGIGTTTPTQKLDVNGNLKIRGDIDLTGDTRRIYFGNVPKSTFGIAYSPTYPDHGIFYTEGTPDFVSISPNGELKNGVLNIYGNGETIVNGNLTTNGNLRASGTIDFSGNNRRIYLGGVFESTFGIAYSPTYPDHGIFYTEGTPDFVSISPNGELKNGVLNVYGDGKVGIGTTQPDMELTVNGTIHAKEIKIDLDIPAPDYVFKEDYNLRSLEEVENFILENSHLPEIPSAKEFEQNGIMQSEMNMSLLKKIEELVLYTIQQEKKIKSQDEKIDKLELINKKLLELQIRLEKLEKE